LEAGHELLWLLQRGTLTAAQDADKSRLLEEKAQDGRAICGRGGGGQVARLARRECVESV